MVETKLGKKIYLVGGAVRDMQMGLPCNDYDFVAVGYDNSDFKTYKLIGNDFPVYLEPTHGWEVALARIERKVGKGYTGFEADWKGVTLEQDLYRRDLTINALAIEVDFEASVALGEPVCVGQVIDYFGGLQDIEDKVLKPVSEAFLEDPLRVLRAARFMAKFENFIPHWKLIDYVLAGATELKNLTPERVWLETTKALSCKKPSEYFTFLKATAKTRPTGVGGFLKELVDLESVDGTNDYHKERDAFIHTMMVVDKAKELFNDPEITFAGLVHDLGKAVTWGKYGVCHGHEDAGVPVVEEFCKKYKVPNNYRDLALITTKQHLKCHNVLGRGSNKMMRPKSIMKMFEETAALSKPERFKKMLKACEADAVGRIGIAANDPYIQRQYLEECLQAVLDFKTKDLSQQLLSEGKSGILIGQRIREERIKCIRQVQNKWKEKMK